ncbi:MAG: biotin/lipoyl-containing protein [Candidatus Bathyarchaeia archaeon]|jgi:biotin carboxyl carrier protein
MPDYEVVINGRPRKIELARTSPDSFTAKVEGRTRQIKLQRDGIASEKASVIEIDGKTYRIELAKGERGRKISVRVEEAGFEVEVKTANRGQALTSFEPTPRVATKKTGTNKKVAVEGAVTAPMTGKIVKVKVKKGDQVKAGQVLCVIEAMKMENEISAPRAGTIQEVNVAEMTPVNEGETLFVIV